VLVELVGGTAISFIASLIACRALVARGPRDHPNEDHKEHDAPTPTSGGLGIAAGFVLGLIAVFLSQGPWQSAAAAHNPVRALMLLGLATALLLIGYVDDRFQLNAAVKFSLFGLLSVAGALSAGVVEALPLGMTSIYVLPFGAGVFGTTLWIFTLINSVNFMDGSNGLAMGSMAVGLCTLAAIARVENAPAILAACLCCAGAVSGFLVWNAPAGRLFAGDSGSLFVGAIAALGALVLIKDRDLSPFVPPIIFFPPLADTLLTLLWRVQRGRSVFVGHTEHLYQIALRAWPGHVRVAVIYWVAMALCGALAFYVAREPDPAAPWIALTGLAVLSIVISAFMRSWAAARGYLAP